MTHINDMAVDDILYSIQISGITCFIELNLSPKMKAQYYPGLSAQSKLAPVLMRFYDGKETIAVFGSDIKACLIGFFEQHPQWIDKVFGATEHHD